jgi:hypothetical protein
MSARPQAVFTLDALKKSWLKAKADEREANERRVAIEKRMLSMLGSLVPQEGTFNQDGLTISTGYTRKWDQTKLTTLAVCIDPSYWPFKTEWREDRKASRVFEERFPDLWKHVSSALTLTEKKPSVTVEES